MIYNSSCTKLIYFFRLPILNLKNYKETETSEKGKRVFLI